MFLHSPAMSEGAAGLTPRIDLCRVLSYLYCIRHIKQDNSGVYARRENQDNKKRSMTAKVKAMTNSEQYIPYFVAAAVAGRDLF